MAIYIQIITRGRIRKKVDVGNQRKLLTEYVNKHDDFLSYMIIYIDDGFTGTNFNRPDFHRMIADIEDNKVNCVVVKTFSRSQDEITLIRGDVWKEYFQSFNVHLFL